MPLANFVLRTTFAVGGGGAIYEATLTNPVLKDQNGGNERVVVKEVKLVEKLTEEENALIF